MILESMAEPTVSRGVLITNLPTLPYQRLEQAQGIDNGAEGRVVARACPILVTSTHEKSNEGGRGGADRVGEVGQETLLAKP